MKLQILDIIHCKWNSTKRVSTSNNQIPPNYAASKFIFGVSFIVFLLLLLSMFSNSIIVNGSASESNKIFYIDTATEKGKSTYSSFLKTSKYENFEGITTGDFNGDSKDDLIIGVYNSKERSNFFEIRIIFGENIDKHRIENASTGTYGLVIAIPIESIDSHILLDCGDINNDGYSDIFIGGFSLENSLQDQSSFPSFFIIFGCPRDLVPYKDFNDIEKTTVYTKQSNYSFIISSDIGDLNNDGCDDFVFETITNYGATDDIDSEEVKEKDHYSQTVYVLFGDSSITSQDEMMLQINKNTLAIENDFTRTNLYIQYFPSNNRYLKIFDFSGDGKNDLILGSPFFSGESSNFGRIDVFYNDRFQQFNCTLFRFFDSNVTIFGDEEHYLMGGAISYGDFNGDNKQDFSIANFIIFGGNYTARNNSISKMSLLELKSQMSNIYLFVDINGDKIDDIVYSNFGYQLYLGRHLVFFKEYRQSCGAIFIIFGNITHSSGFIDVEKSYDIAVIGDNEHIYFGHNILLGDFNGDGHQEIIATSFVDKNLPGKTIGTVNIFFTEDLFDDDFVILDRNPKSDRYPNFTIPIIIIILLIIVIIILLYVRKRKFRNK